MPVRNTYQHEEALPVSLEYLPGLLTRSAQLDTILNHMPHGMCMFDVNKRLVLCNAAYAKLYALPAALLVPGTPLPDILAYRNMLGNAPKNLDRYFDVVAVALHKGDFQSARIQLEDGRTIQITHNPMPDGGYIATHEDVTASVLAEDKILFLATHDTLTGLLNRSSFEGAVHEAVTNIEPKRTAALHYLDLDKFKAVNDTLGHPAGDVLLQQVSERWGNAMGSHDTFARLGGDEFGILQVDIEDTRDADALAMKLIEQAQRPFDILGNTVGIGASVGIVAFDSTQTPGDELLRRADVALYRAKAAGRNTYRHFSD